MGGVLVGKGAEGHLKSRLGLENFGGAHILLTVDLVIFGFIQRFLRFFFMEVRRSGKGSFGPLVSSFLN